MASLNVRRTHKPRWPLRSYLESQTGNPLFSLTTCYFVVCMLLGGGTRNGFLGDTILQLAGLPLLAAALYYTWAEQDRLGLSQWCFWGAGAIALVPLIQLIPLPPSIWANLPGRTQFLPPFFGADLPWLSITLAPNETVQSLCSLIPPLAIFFGGLSFNKQQRSWILLVVLTVICLSILLGVMQLNGGARSPLRFFEATNRIRAVGFFANANHLGALLAAGIPMALVWCISVATSTRRSFRVKLVLSLVFAMLIAVFLSAEALTKSRSGLLLAVYALIVGIVLFGPAILKRGGSYVRAGYWASIASMLAFGGTLTIIAFPSIQPEAVDATRATVFETTYNGAWAYWPIGSGIGTFIPIYKMLERPTDVQAYYINRAHNELLELMLETGALGLSVTAVLVSVFVVLTYRRWRIATERPTTDNLLPVAAAISMSVFMLQSLVDYPLRTSACMSVFAAMGAILILGSAIEPPRQPRRVEPLRSSHEPSRGPVP